MTLNLESTKGTSYPDETAQFAEINGVKGPSVRRRYSQTGSYFGVVPLKLANRRLKWPHVIVSIRGPVAANDDSVSANVGEVA
ncbi:hypothetical protein ACXIUT_20890 [Achromobacter denitrificans]